jgi:hypothetical protein
MTQEDAGTGSLAQTLRPSPTMPPVVLQIADRVLQAHGRSKRVIPFPGDRPPVPARFAAARWRETPHPLAKLPDPEEFGQLRAALLQRHARRMCL